MKFYLPTKQSLITLCLTLFSTMGFGATFTVTNANDSGPGSLRQAILDANASPGADIINITATGMVAMPNNSSLTITEDVTINGNSNYTLVMGSGTMLNINSDNVTIDGLNFEDDVSFFTNVNAIISNGSNQLVVMNCVFTSIKLGVRAIGGEDLLIHANTFEGSGTNGACLNADNITESITTNRSLDFYNNTFIGGGDALVLNNIQNLTFNTSGTSDIVLDVAGGHKSMSGTVLEIHNMDNLIIDGLDLGFDDGTVHTSGRSFTANSCSNLTFQNIVSNNRKEGYFFTNCDTVLIHNNSLTRTDPNGGNPSQDGISVNSGSNITVTDNSFTNFGQASNRFALVLSDIIADSNGDRLDVRGNTFSTCSNAVRVSNMDDIEIDEILVPGTTEIHLTGTDGRKTSTGVNIRFSGVDNLLFENFDLGFDDGLGSSRGTAADFIDCDNSIIQNNTANNRNTGLTFSNCDTLTVQNNTLTRTSTNGGQPSQDGISISSGSNVSVLNNSFTNIAQANNRFALVLNEIGFDVNMDRLNVQGNTFSDCVNAVSIVSMDDLEIDETYVPGVTEIHLPDTDGRHTCTGINLRLSNCRNLLIENFDLGSSTTGNPVGTALDAINCDNFIFQNNTSDNRLLGFYFSNCDTLTVDNNTANHTSGSGQTRSGISITNGSNAIITNNVLVNQGEQANLYALNIDQIQNDTNGDRVDCHTNTFTNCGNGIRMANMDNLEIDQIAIASTEVHLPDTDGRQGCDLINVHINNCDNIDFDGFNLSYVGAGSLLGIGLNTLNCNNLSVTNNVVDNRLTAIEVSGSIISVISNNIISNIQRRGIYVSFGSNSTVTNNTLTNTGIDSNPVFGSLSFFQIANDGSSRLDVTGNTFNGGTNGLYFQELPNLNVSDTYISGTTEVHMPNNTGLNDFSSRAYFNSCDNLSLSNFTWIKNGIQSTGIGIRVDNSENVTLDNLVLSKYNTAAYFTNNTDLTIQNSTFSTGVDGLRIEGTHNGLTILDNVLDGFYRDQ